MLAVLRIATGGFKYMTSEAVGAKGDARETIQGAVFGLILLLGSYLILYTINPQILNLSALQFKSLQPEQCAEGEGCAGDRIKQDEKEREEAEKRAKEFVNGMVEGENDFGEKILTKVEYIEPGRTSDRDAHAEQCRNIGGKFKTYNAFKCKNDETKKVRTIYDANSCRKVTETQVEQGKAFECTKILGN